MTTAPPDASTRRMPRRAGFWFVTAALMVLTSAAGAPSPLYVVYQQRWGFSSLALTAVFAVYAVALLVALLTVGGLSDHLGRRPLLAVSLLVDAVAMVAFLTADGVGSLVVARVVQGVATGAAMGVISAYLVDLQPPTNPKLGSLVNSVGATLGLAVGALGTGLLLQFAPAPTTLVYVVLAALLVAAAVVVPALPETVSRRPGALRSLRPHVAVPARARRAFMGATPVLVATWAMAGLYLSLGPTLAVGMLHISNHIVAGLVVSTLTAAGGVASFIARDMEPRLVMSRGAAVLAVGTVGTLVALDLGSVAGFFVGSAIAGAGFGSAFLGAFRSVASLAEAHERAELFAAVFVVSYVAFSVPAVVAGLVLPSLGLEATATAYGAVIVLLALVATFPRRDRAAAVEGVLSGRGLTPAPVAVTSD